MARLTDVRDIYGETTWGGPITRTRVQPRRLREPRERTLTELEKITRDEDDFESALEQECGD